MWLSCLLSPPLTPTEARDKAGIFGCYLVQEEKTEAMTVLISGPHLPVLGLPMSDPTLTFTVLSSLLPHCPTLSWDPGFPGGREEEVELN